ncbi:hypothetical protein, partial [Escherichia coli]
GVWTEQQWGAAGGKGTVTDDGGRKALRLEKQPGKLTSWKMFRTVQNSGWKRTGERTVCLWSLLAGVAVG